MYRGRSSGSRRLSPIQPPFQEAACLPTVKGSPMSQRHVPSGWRRATSIAYTDIGCGRADTFHCGVHQRDVASLDKMS